MRRLLFSLLCLATPFRAAGADTPPVQLERAWAMTEMGGSTCHARALLLDVITKPEVPRRTAAEAMWLVAKICQRHGSDQAAILVLDKLGRDYPDVIPFSRAATAWSVEMARGGAGEADSPNPADVAFCENMARLVAAGFQLQDRPSVMACLLDLEDVLAFMKFEMALANPDLFRSERPRRSHPPRFHEEAHARIQQVRQALAAGGTLESVLALLQPTLDALQERDLDPEDLNLILCQSRDAMMLALGARDAGRTAAAFTAFGKATAPLMDGPEKLMIVQSLKSCRAASERAVALSKDGHFHEALEALRQGEHLNLASGGAGTGLVIEDAAAIPSALRLRVLGGILQIETALGALQEADATADAMKATVVAIRQFTALVEETKNDLPCRNRLERTLQRIKEARTALAAGETGRATDLLMTEMYVTR